MNFKLATQCYRYNFLLENFVVFSRTSTNFKFWIWMFPNYEKNCRKYTKKNFEFNFKAWKKNGTKAVWQCVRQTLLAIDNGLVWFVIVFDCMRCTFDASTTATAIERRWTEIQCDWNNCVSVNTWFSTRLDLLRSTSKFDDIYETTRMAINCLPNAANWSQNW